jgi:hypothetical protein
MCISFIFNDNTMHPYPETSTKKHYASSSFEYPNCKALKQVKMMPPFVHDQNSITSQCKSQVMLKWEIPQRYKTENDEL